jgi:hypothetical protein
MMKKIFILFLAPIIFFFSFNIKTDDAPLSDDVSKDSTQPVLADPETPTSQLESEINPIVKILFSGDSEKLSFDDIIINLSDGDMTAKLIDGTRTDAKVSMGDDVYYPVNPNLMYSDVKISPLDTFIEILNSCEYIETEFLNEHIVYTFIFHAFDINGEKNEICVYVTRSCVKFTYNGVSGGKEYANMVKNSEHRNICAGYDSYIHGIIPDENGHLLTIW